MCGLALGEKGWKAANKEEKLATSLARGFSFATCPATGITLALRAQTHTLECKLENLRQNALEAKNNAAGILRVCGWDYSGKKSPSTA